ncbi:MAG: hypothetical protein LBE92_10660 [Chryseobacterium sp.]|jgi:hypothetical protein|uniref:hypothetical protein n=1 Tax=Chryseobacterium sp. TaxID=1871047 RepID=UPI0028226846|nr:hypothetical protein [Chryseobacterium sp.]MDR2236577.1 hypothetical protein [Chryseobacterium sp.]
MKKLILILSIAAGISASAQSNPLQVNNYNPTYTADGRFMTVSPIPYKPYMYASDVTSSTTYMVPPNGNSTYYKFNTTGTANIPIPKWLYVDPVNTANTGTYPYNHPLITAITTVDEWEGYAFSLRDSNGQAVDSFEVGDPVLSSGFLQTSQSGVNTPSFAEWFTITSATGDMTYLQIY